MRYLEFRKLYKSLPIFNLDDIRKTDPLFYRNRLTEWQKKHYIIKLKRGYYFFSDLALTEDVLYFFANKLYPHSYVSVEMALSHYQFIPEAVYAVTSVSTTKTMQLTTPIGTFIYHSIKPTLFFGYQIKQTPYGMIKLAEPEKAILDYFYFHTTQNTFEDFEELRLDALAIKRDLRWPLLIRYLHVFNNQRLHKCINRLEAYCTHA